MTAKSYGSSRQPVRDDEGIVEFSSVKLSRPFVEMALVDATAFSRSLGSQIEHWARLGRLVESTSALDTRQAVTDAAPVRLPGRTTSFDALDAAMRSAGPSEVEAMRTLGLSEGAAGYDEQGELVVRDLPAPPFGC